MNNSWVRWGYIIGIGISSLIGILAIKQYYETKNPIYFFWMLVSTIGYFYFYYKSLFFEGIAIINALLAALGILAITAIGVLYYKEKLNKLQLIGIGLVIVGVVLIQYYK
jgi:multidrug transporter EmrE-like cation transporter